MESHFSQVAVTIYTKANLLQYKIVYIKQKMIKFMKNKPAIKWRLSTHYL